MSIDAGTMQQPSLPSLCPIAQAVLELSLSGVEERGAIYTRSEVVDFILDLAGYTPDLPLYELRVLEPSFGEGNFLLPVVERLLRSWQKFRPSGNAVEILSSCIQAVELHQCSYYLTRGKLVELLTQYSISRAAIDQLLDQWLIHDDFLLFDAPHQFDCVIGNPPYVRQERIPDVLMQEYRRRYITIYDRADLYIPFIEQSLRLLVKKGRLAFICSDRWMKNRYGGPLRDLISKEYCLKAYVDMVDTAAFYSDVIAYPAITLITRERSVKTRIAHKPEIDEKVLSGLAKSLTSKKIPGKEIAVKEVAGIANGVEPWILESPDQLAIVRRLEAEFPTLEETGCKVGIGVATGADKAFIAPFETLDVEGDRKLPLARTHDILSGCVDWQGYGIINPFKEEGGLVALQDYPKLAKYLEDRRDQIEGRHVAKKSPDRWYRTIDRIHPDLTYQEKLLIPDIKGDAHIVYEEGKLYPHHNLYYITAKEWNLRALQTVLKSGIARLFVSTYSTKMRGGYLRFQAQYLRRIRVPYWSDVPPALRTILEQAALTDDVGLGNEAVYTLYGLNKKERAAIGGNGKI